MKIYRLTYNINKDDLLASKLSKQIFSLTKGYGGNNFYQEINIDNVCSLYLVIKYGNQEVLRYGTFDISAAFSGSKSEMFSPSMQFNISLSKDFSKLHYDKLYYTIFDVVKHELGHYYQYKTNKNNLEDNQQEKGKDMLDACIKIKEYILSESEFIPYIKGIVFASKKSKKPVEVLLDESLDVLFFHNDINIKNKVMLSSKWGEINKVISDIKYLFIDKAKQLYPYLRK